MMSTRRKTKIVGIDDLKVQVALLKDQLTTAQAMLEEEAKARISLEARLMQQPSNL